MKELTDKLKEFLGVECIPLGSGDRFGKHYNIKLGDKKAVALPVINDNHVAISSPGDFYSSITFDGKEFSANLDSESVLNHTDYETGVWLNDEGIMVNCEKSLDDYRVLKRRFKVNNQELEVCYDEMLPEHGAVKTLLQIEKYGEEYSITKTISDVDGKGNVNNPSETKTLSKEELLKMISEDERLRNLIPDMLSLINNIFPSLYKKILSSYQWMRVFNDKAIRNPETDTNYKLRVAPGCPVDTIRQYIEGLKRLQKEYIAKGEPLPYNVQIPSEIVLSGECVAFWNDGHLRNFLGMPGEKYGNEFGFYWPADDVYSDLYVCLEYRDDNMYHMTYIKEGASGDSPEFIWKENKNSKGKEVFGVVKDFDDVYDMFPYSPSEEIKTKRRNS